MANTFHIMTSANVRQLMVRIQDQLYNSVGMEVPAGISGIYAGASAAMCYHGAAAMIRDVDLGVRDTELADRLLAQYTETELESFTVEGVPIDFGRGLRALRDAAQAAAADNVAPCEGGLFYSLAELRDQYAGLAKMALENKDEGKLLKYGGKLAVLTHLV